MPILKGTDYAGARPCVIRTTLNGNPAIMGFNPKTGGFASPSFDGFALAHGQ
jgi:hypothetical protein